MANRYRTRYDRLVVTSPRGGASLTRQSERSSCDIPSLLLRYSRGLQLARPVQYGDAVDTPQDLLTAYEVIQRAESQFAGLPSAVRDKFANSPLKLLEFVSDEKNRPEAEKLGILRPKSDPPADPKPPVTPEGQGVAPVAPPPLDVNGAK